VFLFFDFTTLAGRASLLFTETDRTTSCEAGGPVQLDASSLVQVVLKDPPRATLLTTDINQTVPGPVVSTAETTASVADSADLLTKSTGMQAWILMLSMDSSAYAVPGSIQAGMLGFGPAAGPAVGPPAALDRNLAAAAANALRPAKWPTSDEIAFSRSAAQRNPRMEVTIIIVCNAICCVFICLWFCNRYTVPSLHKDSSGEPQHSHAGLGIPMSSNDDYLSDAEPGASSKVDLSDYSEEELLDVFASLPMGWRHLLIFMCAILGYLGAGGLNDTIGLTFGSFEKEWGAQSQSKLACLSLVSTAGQILASIFVGHIADLYGRCFVVRYASILTAICAGLSAVAPSLEILALARFLGGVGYGSINITIPTLLSECAPQRNRYLIVLYQFGWPAGAAVFTYIMALSGWRIAMVAFLPFATIMLAVFWCPGCLPESPKWLCSQGKLKEASEAVAQFGDVRSVSNTVQRIPSTFSTGSEGSPQTRVVQSFYIRVALSILCITTASMLIKVWLPQVLAQRGVRSSTMAFVTMWAVESVALIASGFIFGAPQHKQGTSSGNLSFLRVSQIAFIAAGCAVLGCFKATSSWLITLLGITHLLGQSNAHNFLVAFATLSFPVAVRARCVAGLYLASYGGCFVGPLLGAILLQSSNPIFGAYSALSTGCFIYLCGFIGVLGLESEQLKQ